MPDQRTIWKRRAALMAVIGLIVAVPVTIALSGGADSDPAPEATEPPAPQRGQLERNRRLGVSLRLPDDWKRQQRKAGGAVAYRSGDGSVLVAISAPGPAGDADSIQEAAVGAIEDQYRAVDVVKRSSRLRLGRRPAETAAVAARNPKTRDPVRILVTTAKGRKRAYLIEVFAAGSDPTAAQVEAQVILDGLRLQG
jgi:hypothetical protein